MGLSPNLLSISNPLYWRWGFWIRKRRFPMNGFLLVVSFGFFRIVLPLAILFLFGEWIKQRQNNLHTNSWSKSTKICMRAKQHHWTEIKKWLLLQLPRQTYSIRIATKRAPRERGSSIIYTETFCYRILKMMRKVYFIAASAMPKAQDVSIAVASPRVRAIRFIPASHTSCIGFYEIRTRTTDRKSVV